jgi:hypothetical protein
MATTKILKIYKRLDHLVDYVSNTDKTNNPDFDSLKTTINYAENLEKTEQKYYTTGINCTPETAYQSMSNSIKLSRKSSRILGYHLIQSFAEGEVNAGTAHEIGVKLAEELWGDKFQVVVATHLNTKHYHNHFVLCSTSFKDGSKFNDCATFLHQLRDISDRLCREYSLSVIESSETGRSKEYTEWEADTNDEYTVRGAIRKDIDAAIAGSTTPQHFYQAMKAMGYEIDTSGKHAKLKMAGRDRFCRFKSLGDGYMPEQITEHILRNVTRTYPETSEQEPIEEMFFKGDLKNAQTIIGYRMLYIHYCYGLKIVKERPSTNRRMHFLLRDDLRKLDKIIAESNFLCDNKIDTEEQLALYRASIEEKVSNLIAKRSELRNELKRSVRSGDESRKLDIKDQLSDISTQLKKLRKDIVLCDNISARSKGITEKMNIAQEEIKQRKENYKYESIRGSSRPNR